MAGQEQEKSSETPQSDDECRRPLRPEGSESCDAPDPPRRLTNLSPSIIVMALLFALCLTIGIVFIGIQQAKLSSEVDMLLAKSDGQTSENPPTVVLPTFAASAEYDDNTLLMLRREFIQLLGQVQQVIMAKQNDTYSVLSRDLRSIQGSIETRFQANATALRRESKLRFDRLSSQLQSQKEQIDQLARVVEELKQKVVTRKARHIAAGRRNDGETALVQRTEFDGD